MTKTESTIRFLFGASRKDIRPLVHAVDITIKLMFSQGIPMDDIRVTHAVYPQVAKRLKTRSGASPSAKTTARRIQRLANACWDALVERNLVNVPQDQMSCGTSAFLLVGTYSCAAPSAAASGRSQLVIIPPSSSKVAVFTIWDLPTRISWVPSSLDRLSFTVPSMVKTRL